MSVRTRASGRERRGSHSGATFLRSLLLLTLLGCLSFVLGFFVIAKVVPGINKPEVAAMPSANAADSPSTQAGQSPSVVASQPQTSPVHSAAPPALPSTQPRANNTPGPSIDPVDDGPAIQKPGTPDEPGAGETRTHVTRANRETPPTTTEPKTADSKTGTASETTRARRKRRQAAETPHLQTPANPDGDSGDAASPATGTEPTANTAAADPASAATTGNPNAAASPASGSYRVQLGVFATRAKADEVAEQARAKGFGIYVKRYRSRSGKRLFRVQQGIYQDREHADQVRQQLQDSGLNASVNPN